MAAASQSVFLWTAEVFCALAKFRPHDSESNHVFNVNNLLAILKRVPVRNSKTAVVFCSALNACLSLVKDIAKDQSASTWDQSPICVSLSEATIAIVELDAYKFDE